jgi:hypothetical protein
VATARGGTSLHLTLTITEPAPTDLVEALLTTFAPGDLPGSGTEFAGGAVAALLDHLGSVEERVLVDTAVGTMRKRTV